MAYSTYDRNADFRNEDYRQIHHQSGVIGHFKIRLLEAAALDRHYWSALALGPIKHLGFSKAHGEISSYVSFGLTGELSKTKTKYLHKEPTCYASPVVSRTNNPVWTDCTFDLPLHKGEVEDGEPIHLFIKVEEDSTAIENFIPGIPSGGTIERLLGVGVLNLTKLCLGQDTTTGRAVASVIDEWIPINLPDDQDKKISKHNEDSIKVGNNALIENSVGTGRVRVLISYHRNGLKPQKNDIVALEAFARQSLKSSTCIPVVPSFNPLRVVEINEPWLLVKYQLSYGKENGSSDNVKNEMAFIKIHKNAVFVIERKNILDITMAIALKPAKLILSNPIGRGVQDSLEPVIVASKQLIMPVLLSSRLVWMAVRTTALAGLSGAKAASSSFFSEGSNSLTSDGKRQRHTDMLQYV